MLATLTLLIPVWALGAGGGTALPEGWGDPSRYWRLAELAVPPAYRAAKFSDSQYQGLKALLVEGKGPNGTAADFFCYYGRPAGPVPSGGFPGVVLVHGGGGTAFPNLTALWVSLGFAVIAPDWYNQRPAFTNVAPTEATVSSVPLAGGKRKDHVANVANMVLAHSLLRSFPEVNADRTVFVGLSWGSWYGTCVAAVDDRFKGCVEIYCGDLKTHCPGADQLVFGQFLPAAKIPMWWAVSTNDRNVTPATSQAGFDACARFAGVAIVNDLPHSHVGFRLPSVQRMARHFTGGAKPLPRLVDARIVGGVVSARLADPGEGVDRAVMGYTLSSDPVTWKREWRYRPAKIDGDRVSAALPEGTVQCYLSVYEKGESRYNDLCGSTGFLQGKE